MNKFGPNGDSVAALLEVLTGLDAEGWRAFGDHLDARYPADRKILRTARGVTISAAVDQAIRTANDRFYVDGSPMRAAGLTTISAVNLNIDTALTLRALAYPEKFPIDVRRLMAERYAFLGIDLSEALGT